MSLGLKEQMQKCELVSDCQRLYDHGMKNFTSPSGKTKRQWKKILDSKSKEIKNNK